MIAFARTIPLHWGLFLGTVMGRLAYWVVIAERKKAENHLKIVFPEKDGRWRRETVKQMYANFGKSFFEVFHLKDIFDGVDGKGRFTDYIEIIDDHHFSQQLEKGRGALFITGHCGNWELLAALVVKRGFRLRPIVRKLYDPRLDDLLNQHRIENGYPPITRTGKEMESEIADVLKSNGILGILIDQDTKVRSVFAPFLGYPASTPSGPAYLAYKLDMDVIIALIHRKSKGGHQVVTLPPIPRPKTGSLEGDIVAYTSLINEVISNYILQYPTEWVWMHRRWNTRPEGEQPKDRPAVVRPKEKLWWSLIQPAARTLFSKISWELADRLGMAAGSIAAVLKFRKKTAMQNMRRLFSGNYSNQDKRALYRGSCQSAGRNMVRYFKSAQMSSQYYNRYFQIENQDAFENEIRNGAGVLLLCANIGSWESVLFKIAAMGYGVTLVCETKDPAFYDRWIDWNRRRGQIFTISKDESEDQLLKLFNKKSCMAFLFDDAKNIRPNCPGSVTDRLNVMAHKMAAISNSTGASVIPAYSLWDVSGKHKVVFGQRLTHTPKGGSDKRITGMVQMYNEAFKGIVDACAQQYHWIKAPKYE